jgi:Putative zinc ribbon domain
MDDKPRCQSCGMPLSADFGNYGTDAAGSPVSEYCMFCFKEGAFTNPDQTVQEMIASSIENMTGDIGMPVEQATQLANNVIPSLKRWQTS